MHKYLSAYQWPAPILVQIVLLQSSPLIEGINLPFSERGLELISKCVREELNWEAQYLRPYASIISDVECGIGGLPIPVLDYKKPIEQFLTLKERMEVALLMSDDAEIQCAEIRVIDKCFPSGVWCRFRILHSFFVVVNITKVNTEYNGQIAYYKDKSITILGAAINYRVLWSGYRVRPMEPLYPSTDI